MLIEGIFQFTLILAAFFCTLVTGLLFVFAVVVMPGIGTLTDREFLRSFQAMDRIIQNNQPLFILVWMGAVATLVIATALGMGQLDGAARLLIIAAAVAYLVGAQLPTIAINIPLNNRLQTLDIAGMDPAQGLAERRHFEARWNRSNSLRTAFAGLTSALLLVLLWLS